MSENRPVSEIFVAMQEQGWKVHEAPDKILVKKFCDYRGGTVTAAWEVIINGNAEARTVKGIQWGELELPPFTAAVFWNGWLAGLIDPYNGVIAANANGANEDALIKSIRAIKGEPNVAALVDALRVTVLEGGVKTREQCAEAYANIMRAVPPQEYLDVAALNEAIIIRWSLAGLQFIKKRAWDLAYSSGIPT
jgi:hypothetical protein